MYSGQTRPEDFYVDLVDAVAAREPDYGPPYVFIGHNGGGAIAMNYTLR